MTEMHTVSDDVIPSYCQLIAPLYRDAALKAFRDIHDLSAALHNTLAAEPINQTAFITLGNAMIDAQDRAGAAVAGMGAAISCVGAA